MKWPKHHSLNISHNEHKSIYIPIGNYLMRDYFRGIDLTDEDREKIIETDEIWECQFYQHAPSLFIFIVVPTWERLVEELNALGEE